MRPDIFLIAACADALFARGTDCSGSGLDLDEGVFAFAAGMAGGIDGFGVALELDAAGGGGAGPDVFVGDGVAVFGRDLDA